ncbi:MAG: GAF domain-containing protein, partial [Anaerolineales bacterium]|nr:GAF domain-containing protein [Anaerolineales bacterium]
SLPMAFPILDPQGQVQAMVVIALDLELVSEMSAELDLPPRSTINLVDTQGNVLASYPNPENWLGKNLGAVPLIQRLLAHQAEGTIEEAGLDGTLRLYGYVPVQSGGQTWGYLFIGIPSQVVYAAADQTWRSSLIAFGLVTALALAATWALGEFSITRRTQALVRTVKRLASGDQSVRSDMGYGTDEISQLGRAFDEMAETLQRRETERKRAEAEIHRRADEFAALYETSRDLVSQQDLATLLKTIVERATKLLAAPRGLMYLYDATANDLELAVEKGALLPPGARLKIGEGMGGRVALTREPMIVDNYSTWEDHAAKYNGIPITAALQVPMLYRGELIGILGITEVGTTTRQFTEA